MAITEEISNQIEEAVVTENYQALQALSEEHGQDAYVLVCALAAVHEKAVIVDNFRAAIQIPQIAIQILEAGGNPGAASYIREVLKDVLGDESDSIDWSAEIMKFIKMTKNPAAHYSVEGRSMSDALSGEAAEIDGHPIMSNWVVYGCENSISKRAYFIPESDANHFFSTVHQAMKRQGNAVYHTLTSVRDIAYPEVLETLNEKYPADKMSEMLKNTQQVFGTEDYGILEVGHEGGLYACLIALKNEWGGYVCLANARLA